MKMRILFAAALAALTGACTVGPDYARPTVEVPAAFRTAVPAGASVTSLRWWEQFGDPALTAIVETALDNNLDLRAAALRLAEFRALRTVAGAPLLPQVNASLNETRSRQGIAPITEVYQGSLSMAWELDFWGRIRRLAEAADADLAGQEEARRAAVLSLVSSVASGYIQLRELDARLEISRRTRDSRAEALRIAKVRFQAGTISELELKQAGVEYEGTVASVQQLEQALAQQENGLNLLLGRNPGPLQRGKRLEELAVPAVPGGLPSDLLTRRPDILQAEQALIGANARVGAARASLFPTISLSATDGGASIQLSELFSGTNRMWSFVPGITLPIFDAGNLRAQETASEARREQALNGYRKAIQAAFRDTEDALVGVVKAGEQKATQARVVGEVRRYAQLAKLRYENGITSNLEVLDSQRSLYNAELALAQTQSAALVAIVNLYKALGGDWEGRDVPDSLDMRGGGLGLSRPAPAPAFPQ